MDCYHKNMEYLVALLLLGKCDCFLGSRTSGTVADIMLMIAGRSGKYSYTKSSLLPISIIANYAERRGNYNGRTEKATAGST